MKKESSKYVKPGTLYGFTESDNKTKNTESGITIQLSSGLNQNEETTYPNNNTAEFSVTALEEGKQEIKITYENSEPKTANLTVRPLPAKLTAIEPAEVNVIEQDIFKLKFIFDKPLVDGQGYPIVKLDDGFEIIEYFTLSSDRSYGEMQIKSLINGTSLITASLGGSVLAVNVITSEHPAKLLNGSLSKTVMDIYGETELTLVFDKKPLVEFIEMTMSPGLEKIGEPTINPENELEVKINLKVIEIGNQRIDIEYKNEIQTFTMESKNPIETIDYVFESLEDLRNRIGDIVRENNYDLSEKVLEFKFNDDISEDIFQNTGIIKTPKVIIYPGKNLSALFRGCSELIDVSRNLFYGCPNLENLYYTFANCSKIELIPGDLFIKNDNLVAIPQLFLNCTSLKSIPDNLLKNKFKCYGFSYTFKGCSSIEYIPFNLFDDTCKDIPEDAEFPYAFIETFNGCTEIQSKLPEIWNKFNVSKYTENCFKDCDRSPNYLDVPKEWGGLDIEPDYYFETFEDFKERIVRICEENGQDLSQKIFKFGDNVTELIGWYSVPENRFSIFPSTITKTPKTIIGKNIKKANYMFIYNKNLIEISNTLLKYLPNLEQCGLLFTSCNISEIPKHFFDYNLSLRIIVSSFWGNSEIDNIPENLFKYNKLLESVHGLFNLTSITSVSNNLFINNKFIKSVSTLFQNCKSLTSIPENLFANCPNIEDASYLFYGCTSLTSIPENLFANCPNIEDASCLFYRCTSLTSIPENLFKNCPKLKHVKGLLGYTIITSIPENLFANCPLLENINTLLYECNSLIEIPEDLFINNPNITEVGLFSRCDIITSIPGGLFRNQHNIVDTKFGATSGKNEMWIFNRAYKNKSIGEGIFDTFDKVTNFTGSFSKNYELEYVPNNLLEKCINAKIFKEFFSWCNSLKYVSEDLFKNCKLAEDFSNCFIGCYGYIGNLPRLWEIYPNAIGTNCFSQCTRAANYLDVPVEWGGVTVDYEFNDLIDAQAQIPAIIEELNGDLSQKIIKFNTEEDLDGELFRNTNIIKTPKMIFYKGKKISKLFQGCEKLTTISADLFAGCPNLEELNYIFKDCSVLATISEGLFRKIVTLKSITGVFSNCAKIKTIPTNLLNNKPQLIGFKELFSGCTGITTIPATLFEATATDKGDSSYAFNFELTFNGCTGLTQLLPLWETFTDETGITDNCYQGCNSASNFSDVPESWK